MQCSSLRRIWNSTNAKNMCVQHDLINSTINQYNNCFGVLTTTQHINVNDNWFNHAFGMLNIIIARNNIKSKVWIDDIMCILCLVVTLYYFSDILLYSILIYSRHNECQCQLYQIEHQRIVWFGWWVTLWQSNINSQLCHILSLPKTMDYY